MASHSWTVVTIYHLIFLLAQTVNLTKLIYSTILSLSKVHLVVANKNCLIQQELFACQNYTAHVTHSHFSG